MPAHGNFSITPRNGENFGDWFVVRETNMKKRKRRILVKCSCGKVCDRDLYSIVSGKSKSCGHEAISKLIESRTKHNCSRRMNKSPTYITWSSMIARCHYKKSASYKRYGARGITVCDEWRNSFQSFLNDMGERPEGLQLDRIDSSKNYSKENCRWVSPKQNSINRSTTKFTTFLGVTLPFSDLCKYFRVSEPSVRKRMKQGMKREAAFSSAYYSPQRGKMWSTST